MNSEEVGEDELASAFNDMGYTYIDSGENYKTYMKSSSVYIEVGLNAQNYWYVAYYDPALLVKQYSSPREVRTYAPKQDTSRLTSEVAIDKSSVKRKLLKCEKAFSVKRK